MSRRVCYDVNGNEIYEDSPTNENVDELKSQIEKYQMALELASVDMMKYIEEGLEGCETCPERAYCQGHRHEMTLFDCGSVFLKTWKEKSGLV